ncbi:hypothetical protein [Flavobacterium sp.]|uniref:hypothetical protein n=1 Tax=Flavobacterium sp. TaxID=239 RepID=UPI00375130F5
MKRVFYISVFSFLLLSNTFIDNQLNNKINITYLGYKNNVYHSDFSTLEFEIVNKSQDTVFLSKENIVLTVIKGKTIIKEEKPSTIGMPFVKPIIRSTIFCKEQKEYQEKINSLKLKFANKLYEKNFGSNTIYKNSKDFIIENIIRDCFILMPNESIDHSMGFYSKKFDKTCKVSVKYSDNKRFTYFVDDSGKKIDITN